MLGDERSRHARRAITICWLTMVYFLVVTPLAVVWRARSRGGLRGNFSTGSSGWRRVTQRTSDETIFTGLF